MWPGHLQMWSERSDLNASWVHSHLSFTLSKRHMLIPGLNRAYGLMITVSGRGLTNGQLQLVQTQYCYPISIYMKMLWTPRRSFLGVKQKELCQSHHTHHTLCNWDSDGLIHFKENCVDVQRGSFNPNCKQKCILDTYSSADGVGFGVCVCVFVCRVVASLTCLQVTNFILAGTFLSLQPTHTHTHTRTCAHTWLPQSKSLLWLHCVALLGLAHTHQHTPACHQVIASCDYIACSLETYTHTCRIALTLKCAPCHFTQRNNLYGCCLEWVSFL